jgi:cyclic pyranopterin phosphate synthase
LLRADAADEEILQRMIESVQAKKAGHGIDNPDFIQPQRSMHAIGG